MNLRLASAAVILVAAACGTESPSATFSAGVAEVLHRSCVGNAASARAIEASLTRYRRGGA